MKEDKFKARKEKFLSLVRNIKVKRISNHEIMVRTIEYKLKEGLERKDFNKFAKAIRGAMFAYIRHELVLGYDKALKELNSHPERDELYLIIKRKANMAIDKEYKNIRANKKKALDLLVAGS